MAKLLFDATGERKWEAGVSQGVLFPGNPSAGEVHGIPWNGLTNFTKSPEGGEANDQWADNIKYASIRGAEDINGTIEAFMYPPEFHACMGEKELVPGSGAYVSQQDKEPFSFACLTGVGSDTTRLAQGAKLHIIYNATVNPSEMAYETINDSPEAMAMSWEFDTVPVASNITGLKPTSYLTIEKTESNSAAFNEIIGLIYGTDTKESTLPLPSKIYEVISSIGG